MDLRTNVARRSLRHDQCFGYREPVREWGYDTFLAHVDAEDRGRVDACYQRAMSGGGDYDVEFRVNWPDSSVHWLWSKGRFFFDDSGLPYRVAGIQVDITERRRDVQAAIRFAAIVESSEDAIISQDRSGVVTSWNPGAARLFGHAAAQMLGQSLDHLVAPGANDDERKYFDLATWHLINTVYAPARLAEVRGMKAWYVNARHHARLMKTLQERLGHALAAAAEQAKIDVALNGTAQIDLWLLERGLTATLAEAQAAQAIELDLERIVQAARETARQAGLAAGDIDVLYFTGGSTGLNALVTRIAACFPQALRVRGDRFASVAQGLGWHARAVFGPGP